MITIMKLLLLTGSMLTGVLLFCTSSAPTAGIEVTNGSCTGTIYTADSAVAPGALVILVPTDFDPLNPMHGTIDSTRTDDTGRFSFRVTSAGMYNLIAKKNGAASMKEAVPLQPEAVVTVNDTLQQPGTLSGKVTLKPDDDARKAIILIRGTNYYTSPFDSNGTFITSPLPAGTFSVQILVPGSSEYAVIDTTVVLESGKNTELYLNLFIPGAPPVTGFTAHHDSVTMHTLLSWEQVDTSQIVSYRLLRKCAAGTETTVMIGKTATSYTDDVVLLEDDTIRYYIAAIGNNYTEGYRSATAPVIPKSIYQLTKVLPIDYDYTMHNGGDVLYVDDNENVYFTNWMGIQKFDAKGVRQQIYRINYEAGEYGLSELCQDDFGKYYYLCSNVSGSSTVYSVIKFNEALETIAIVPVFSRINAERALGVPCIAVTGGGAVYALLDSAVGQTNNYVSGYSRHIRIFDNEFNCRKDYYVTSTTSANGFNCYGDTLVIREAPANASEFIGIFLTPACLRYYDQEMNAMGEASDMRFIIDLIPSEMFISHEEVRGTFSSGPGGVVITHSFDVFGTPVTLLSRQQQLLCRKSFVSPVVFDSKGNIYCYRLSYADKSAEIYKYSRK